MITAARKSADVRFFIANGWLHPPVASISSTSASHHESARRQLCRTGGFFRRARSTTRDVRTEHPGALAAGRRRSPGADANANEDPYAMRTPARFNAMVYANMGYEPSGFIGRLSLTCWRGCGQRPGGSNIYPLCLPEAFRIGKARPVPAPLRSLRHLTNPRTSRPTPGQDILAAANTIGTVHRGE